MNIYPAIDLKESRVVRLSEGDYDRVNIYSENPLEMVKKFKSENASNLHVVDLDGAKDGRLVNYRTIYSIVKESGLFVQVGGGIRDEERIKQYLDIGTQRVILGTVALEDFDFTRRMVEKYKEKIAVSVDARNQKVAVKGWKEITDTDSVEFCKKLAGAGVETIIYTDISRDGMLNGTNLDVYELLNKEIDTNIIASGGISFIDEIKTLTGMNVYGAILGKALYEKKLSLAEAVRVAGKGGDI